MDIFQRPTGPERPVAGVVVSGIGANGKFEVAADSGWPFDPERLACPVTGFFPRPETRPDGSSGGPRRRADRADVPEA